MRPAIPSRSLQSGCGILPQILRHPAPGRRSYFPITRIAVALLLTFFAASLAAADPVQWSSRPAQKTNTLASYPGGGLGSTLASTTSDPAVWDSVAVGSQIAWSDVRFEFQCSQDDKDVAAGLAFNNASPHPASIRFGIRARPGGTWEFNEGENLIAPAPGDQGYSVTDVFAIERSNDGTVRYFKGAQLIRTTTDPPVDTAGTLSLLQPDVAFLQPGAAIENATITLTAHSFPGTLEDHVNGPGGSGGLASPLVEEFVAIDDADFTFDTSAPVEVINVRDPGPIPGVIAASGNGTEEDTDAINSMLDRARANDTAGTRTVLYFPPGIYDCAPDKTEWADFIATQAITGQLLPNTPVMAFEIDSSNLFLVGENPGNTILRFHTYKDAAPVTNDLHDPATDFFSFVTAPMGKTCVRPAGGANLAPNPDGSSPQFRRGVLRGSGILIRPPPPYLELEGLGFRNLTIDGQAGRTEIPWPAFPAIAVDPYEGDSRVADYPWLVDGDGWDQTHQGIFAVRAGSCVMLDCVFKRWRGEIIIRFTKLRERPWVLKRCVIEDSNSIPLSANGWFHVEDCDIGRNAFGSIESSTLPGQRFIIKNTHLHGGVAVRGVSRHTDAPEIRKQTPTYLLEDCTIDIKTLPRFDGQPQLHDFLSCEFGIYGHDVTIRGCTFNVQGNQPAIVINGGEWSSYRNAFTIPGNDLHDSHRHHTHYRIHDNIFNRTVSDPPLANPAWEREFVLYVKEGDTKTVMKRVDLQRPGAGLPDVVPGLDFFSNTVTEETGAEWLGILKEDWNSREFTRDAVMLGEKAINNVSGPGDPSPPAVGLSRWIRIENNVTARPDMVQQLLRSPSQATPELPEIILPAGATPLPKSTEVFVRRTGHDALVWVNGVALENPGTLYRVVKTQQTAAFWGSNHSVVLPVKMPDGVRLSPATPFSILPGSTIQAPGPRASRQNQFIDGFNYSEVYLVNPESDPVEIEIVLDQVSP